MFASWGSIVFRRRWLVTVLVLVLTIGGGLWGLGIFDRLTQGGYDDPNSESARATVLIEQELGQRPADVVVVYTVPDGRNVDEAAFAGPITTALRGLPAEQVTRQVNYWDTKAPQLVDGGKQRGLVTISLAGANGDERRQSFDKIKQQLEVPGVQTQIGGNVPTEQALTEKSNQDLAIAEGISIPITLILLILIFGSVVAASLPVLVGALSIVGSLGVLRLLSLALEVNTFAVNVATLLGLGMAIDYGLFMVGRFREEQAKGATPQEAVRRTVATAGRTVAFSATLLVIALAGLLVFPMDFLKSMAYGGMSAVAIAALVSLTVLPALMGILGHRVEKGSLPWRRGREAGEPKLLGRIAGAVMRRPILFVLPIVAGLALLAIPFGSVTFGGADEKQLPPGDPHRVTAETIAANFPAAGNNTARIILQGANGVAPDPATVQGFIASASQVPGVQAVAPDGAKGSVIVLTAPLDGDSSSQVATDAIAGLRDLPEPPGTDVIVGGYTAAVADSVESIVDGLPWMIAILAGATLLLMFLAFGSVLLPIKAVLMSALSLSATYGVLVFIFQQGHGADLLGITPQPLQAGMVVLIGAVVFGLSTDYETFLLSRMIEARQSGMSTQDAVKAGLVRTGRMITAAALLLGVVTGAFALSGIASMRFIGMGMIIALLLDATVVRIMLVPAILRLLGDAAWWAPGPLRRLQQRAGLGEVSELDDSPKKLEPVG